MKPKFAIDQIPDIRLINALKSDKDHAGIAFKIIYNLHCISLNKLAYGMLKDDEGARYIVQEIFISLWNNRLHQIILEDNIEKYLVHIVKNKCIDILRETETNTFFEIKDLHIHSR
ncbi:hypothetical protein GO495_29055 [Chitinophaga oryziterrae]|uniref:RNA polymerase sigma-70 region 2 domain-containing protein n=1 Tax=Chitinophaga oryziterrae TaxID=1031224 RepID=A0A6N8JHH2_9BACT|nr:sigma factor [Chitinophaga oryziterrae]MVT44677.1 hypothetical protein [Chitinophaga oryziterrae]